MTSLALKLSNRRRPATAGTYGDWSPADVPEVAAGYYWHPNLDTDHGTADFVAVELNGRANGSIAQATVTSQPAQLNESGSLQYRYSDSGDGNHDFLVSAAHQAGWTGATYLAMWVRMSEGTPTSGSTVLFAHQTTAGDQRRIVLINNGTSELWTLTLNSTGAAAGGQTASWDASDDYLRWLWLEVLFEPGGAALYVDQQLRTAVAGAITLTSLFDANAPIGVGNAATGGANVNRLDRATVVYCPGIPALGDRERLRRHLAPA